MFAEICALWEVKPYPNAVLEEVIECWNSLIDWRTIMDVLRYNALLQYADSAQIRYPGWEELDELKEAVLTTPQPFNSQTVEQVRQNSGYKFFWKVCKLYGYWQGPGTARMEGSVTEAQL
jgi:hypothetical protein